MLLLMSKKMDMMSPQVVQLLKCLPVGCVNIPSESHRHVNSSVPREQTEQALASLQVFAHSFREREGVTPVPQECSDLNTSLKHLCALKEGLGNFFYPCRRGSLGAGLLCSLVIQALQRQGFVLNFKSK